MNRIHQFVDYLHYKKDTLNKIVPWFLMAYFIAICLPYLFARSATLNAIFSNSTISYILRFGFLALYGLFGIILLIANKLKTNPPIIIGLGILLLMSLISNLTSADNVISYSIYFTSKISIKSSVTGLYEKLLDSARFAGSLVFFYFIFQVYPYCFKKRNDFTYVVLPAVIIAFIGVMYSLIFERSYLINAVSGGINPYDIKSIFHSKNAYGIFLFEGSASLIFIFFYDSRKWTKFLILLLPIFFVISYLINCKLAAVCIMVLLILSYVYAIIRYFKTRPYISFTMLGIALTLSIGLILVFAIPQFRNIGFIGKIYDKIIDTFKNFNIASFIGRTTEWSVVPMMTNGPFIFIGFSRAVGYNVVSAFTTVNGSTSFDLSDLHNAYVDFYAYHGIIGCILLGLLYVLIIYYTVKLFKKDRAISILIFVIFFVSVLFGMAETYTLFISMSANTFALSFIIVTALVFEMNQYGNKRIITNEST